jgi:hypothetical protein
LKVQDKGTFLPPIKKKKVVRFEIEEVNSYEEESHSSVSVKPNFNHRLNAKKYEKIKN